MQKAIAATEPALMWGVNVLGGVSVSGEGAVYSDFETRRSALLLVRLALASHNGVTREDLADTLWPDEFPDVARPRLRQELARLRRALGPAAEVLECDRLHARLDPAKSRSDREDYETRLKRASLAEDRQTSIEAYERATKLYTGDLAPGFFEPWIVAERLRLQRLQVGALLRLSRLLEEAERFDQAYEYAVQATRVQPFEEDAHDAVLRVLSRQERSADLLAHYEAVQQLFLSGYGIGPSDKLRRWVETVRRRPVRETLFVRRTLQPAAIPVPLDPFLGRARELEQIERRLTSSTRLLTISGPGGMGKTRLSLEAGRRLAPSYGSRVWFVALADLSEPGGLGRAILDALAIEPDATDPVEQIARSLSEEACLLILDNFEQLVDGGAHFVKRVLERCPQLSVLVTTRRKLNLAGEFDLELGPLPYDAPSSDGVELFMNSALAVRSDIQDPTDASARQIAADVVRHLEGIPLAINLAAGRMSALTLTELRDQLSSRFELLVSRQTGVEERHRTLYRTIKWSYDQLRPELQQFFLDLSIFRGGWTAADAATVLQEPRSLNFLEELREQSFVVGAPADFGMHFRMLETLREFAESNQGPARREILGRRHAEAMADIACEMEDAFPTGGHQGRYRHLDAMHENMRAALSWAIRNDPEVGIKLTAGLWRYWTVRSHQAEALGWFDALLTGEIKPSRLVAQTYFGAARCAADHGEFDRAIAWFERCREIGSAIGRPALAASADFNIGSLLYARGEAEQACEIFERILATTTETNDAYLIALLLDDYGAALTILSRYDEAQAHLERAREMLTHFNDPVASAYNTMNIATVEAGRGNFEAAKQLLTEAQKTFTDFELQFGLGLLHERYADIALRQMKLSEADHHIGISESYRTAVKDRQGLANLVHLRARREMLLGKGKQAAALALDAAKLHESVHNRRMAEACRKLAAEAADLGY